MFARQVFVPAIDKIKTRLLFLNQKSNSPMNGTLRANITPGQRVAIVQKKDQRSGALTEGMVKDILTSAPTHPHGIKVRLDNGIVGRVKKILS